VRERNTRDDRPEYSKEESVEEGVVDVVVNIFEIPLHQELPELDRGVTTPDLS
jgi:hypothetical protein